MARTQLLFVALAVLVASAGAALTDKASVQEFANENGQTVLKVQAASPWALYAQFQNIETRLNDLAGERKDGNGAPRSGQWYAIDEWGSQQSNWDLLVQLANVAVGDIWAVLPSVPQKPETLTEYGSKTPRADLKGVAQKICKQIAILQCAAVADSAETALPLSTEPWAAMESDIPALVAQLSSSNHVAQAVAACKLGDLSRVSCSLAEAVGAAGAIPLLVCQLDEATEDARVTAAAALANVCTRCDSNRAISATSGAIPPLIRLLNTASKPSTQAVVAVALAHLAGYEPNVAAIRSAAEANIAPLVHILHGASVPGQRAACFLLDVVASGRNSSIPAIAAAGAIPPLVSLLDGSAAVTQQYAADALASLASYKPSHDAIAAAGAIIAAGRCLLGATSEQLGQPASGARAAASAGPGAGDGAGFIGAALCELVCPITQEPMRDPVVAADGHTYERAAIEAWIARQPTSPMTAQPLEHLQLTPNRALRAMAASAVEAGLLR
eukprot:scaffold10.g2394.t1